MAFVQKPFTGREFKGGESASYRLLHALHSFLVVNNSDYNHSKQRIPIKEFRRIAVISKRAQDHDTPYHHQSVIIHSTQNDNEEQEESRSSRSTLCTIATTLANVMTIL